MPKIAIQAGHVNTKYNSIVALRGSTGSPNEASFNLDIRDRVSTELRKRGFTVQGTDANANDDPKITGQDWDLFFTLHYDAAIYGKTDTPSGGFGDFPQPSTDYVTKKSQALCSAIENEYFNRSGVRYMPKRRNDNTKYYYMWKFLSAKTPCVILETGVGMQVPNDWQLLHFQRDKVVEAITRAVCKAFNINYDIAPAPAPVKYTLPQMYDRFQAMLNNLFVEKEDNTNRNQCFDLAFAWCDFLGIDRAAIRHLYAYQIYTVPNEKTRQAFTFIGNTPDAMPQKGDLVVWAKSFNGTAGHVAVANGKGLAQGKNTDWFEAFAQNDPTGKPAIVKRYNFNDVLGFMRPKAQTYK